MPEITDPDAILEEVGQLGEIVEVTPPERPQSVLPTRKKVRQLPIVNHHYHASSSTKATTAVRTPSSGMKLRLLYWQISAKGTVGVYFRFHNHTSTDQQFGQSYMAANTVANGNLVEAPIEGDVDEALEYVTDAAQQVDVTVVVQEIPGEVVAEEEST